MPRSTDRPRPTREEIERQIDRYVLNEEHRRIIRRRLLDRPTFEKIAEETGLDVSTVKRQVYQYRDVLGQYM